MSKTNNITDIIQAGIKAQISIDYFFEANEYFHNSMSACNIPRSRRAGNSSPAPPCRR